MRAFVKLREALATNRELAQQFKEFSQSVSPCAARNGLSTGAIAHGGAFFEMPIIAYFSGYLGKDGSNQKQVHYPYTYPLKLGITSGGYE